jgi:hypothetical protein
MDEWRFGMNRIQGAVVAVIAAIAASCFAGCGETRSPESGRLKAGETVVTFDDSESVVYFDPDSGKPLKVGTKATVVSDEELPKSDAKSSASLRKVKVRIAEGPFANAVLSLYRENLRPVP